MPPYSPDVEVRATAQRILHAVCWTQWSQLGFSAGAPATRTAHGLIDPEALLVLTFEAAQTLPRLDAALDWWAHVGAPLLSLPRLEALLAQLPPGYRDIVAHFAARVVAAGKASTSWKRRTQGHTVQPPTRLKGSLKPKLTTCDALLLRLRAAFGVGAKADVLAYALCHHNTPFSLPTLPRTLGYSALALRRALQDLILAGLISEAREGTERTFTLRQDGWTTILDVPRLPPWHAWFPRCAFWLRAAHWAEEVPVNDPDRSYLLISTAHDLYPYLRPLAQEAGLPMPNPDRHAHTAFLSMFVDTVTQLSISMLDGYSGPA